jgi:hypothetical protein
MIAQTARLFVAAFIALMGSAAIPSTPPFHAAAGMRASAAVSYIPPLEVRLRKVHIVRPDLIPYPIAYEVVC